MEADDALRFSLSNGFGSDCPFWTAFWTDSAFWLVFRMERRGIEPRFAECDSAVIPLDHRPVQGGLDTRRNG